MRLSRWGELCLPRCVHEDVEDLLAQLLGALLEILGDFLIEIFFELAAEALSGVLAGLINFWKQSSPAVSAIGLAFSGAVSGLLSIELFPHRLIAMRVALPAASLLLAPIATGSAMHLLGRHLRHVGRYASDLATFRGGAIVAFSMALIRWWLVGLLTSKVADGDHESVGKQQSDLAEHKMPTEKEWGPIFSGLALEHPIIDSFCPDLTDHQRSSSRLWWRPACAERTRGNPSLLSVAAIC
jgi:hypothetical protein